MTPLCAEGMALLEMLGPLTQALLPFLPCQESLPGTCVIFLCGCHSHSESERAVSVSVLTCPAHLLVTGLHFTHPEGPFSSNRENRT